MVSNLHLLLNQVLCLCKRSNELFSLLSFQLFNLILMYNIRNLKLLLFCCQLLLLIDQFLSQDAFFIVEVKEDWEVLCELVTLFSLDDSLDFSLFVHVVSLCLSLFKPYLLWILKELPLVLSIHLGLQVLLLPELLLDKRLMMFIKLPRLPQSHLECCLTILFVAHQAGFDCLCPLIFGRDLTQINLIFVVILCNLLVKLSCFLVIFNWHEQIFLVKLDRFESSTVLECTCIFLSRNHTLMGLHLLLWDKCFHINVLLFDLVAK